MIFIIAITTPTMADEYIVQNINNGCSGETVSSIMIAAFLPNQYTCNAGYFLPIHSLECQPCTNGAVCPGGTYDYSDEHSSGITFPETIYSDFIGGCTTEIAGPVMIAEFSPTTYNCGAGYYLPSDGIECEQCPTGHNCNGGRYTYNPSTDQGISINQINLNFNDGNGNTITTTCTYGNTINIPETVPTRPGYTFAGWKVHQETNE